MTTQSRSRKLGDLGERLVRPRLNYLGLRMIEKIETGWGVQRNGSRIVGAWPLRKVSGDYKAIGPNGQSVLVESKWREGDKLLFSDMKPHQIEALDEHARHGGLSLLAWAHPEGAMILLWPCLTKGKALTLDEAKRVQLQRLFN